jgi:hypothetical protein
MNAAKVVILEAYLTHHFYYVSNTLRNWYKFPKEQASQPVDSDGHARNQLPYFPVGAS